MARTRSNRRRLRNVQMARFDDLTSDLLKNILSRLTPKDVVRASQVCREWRTVASSIGIRPLLAYLPIRNQNPYNVNFLSLPEPYYLTLPNNPYDIYDIFTGKAFYLNVHINPRGTICYARDGWVLIYEHYTKFLLFYSPFVEDFYQVLEMEGPFIGAAFSAPPTSSNCVVFIMYETTPKSVSIHTCRHGMDEAWISTIHPIHLPFDRCLHHTVTISKGVFYCMSLSDRVGVFDPQRKTWKVLAVEPTIFTPGLNNDDRERRQFMAEHNGIIYLVRAARAVQPVVYMLDETKSEWVIVKDLDGATFFANAITSFIRTDMPACIRDCICFQAIIGNQCVRYSLRNKRYYPKEDFDLHELERSCSIWVDAPQDPSIFRPYPA